MTGPALLGIRVLTLVGLLLSALIESAGMPVSKLRQLLDQSRYTVKQGNYCPSGVTSTPRIFPL